MATIAELNIRLGLISKDFERSLRTMERSLRSSGQRLSSLGNDLTLAFTAPLAALGAAAIKQAGDIESLKLAMRSTFETAGRSIKDADAELEALRKSALAPGLDFEQAVKASIRLQGVEYSAEAARKTIEEMANAIALTGGTAENLDSVTVQFSQMIAKGKVLSQDLRIVQENMPIISKLMQQAFGTRNAEALQNMGISGREFVDKITAAAATLPRVEGGIKNAIVNAGASARQSLAALGDAINKAFNVTGLLDRFSKSLAGAVDWFKSLNDGTKRLIIEIGVFAIAIGPAVKVLGTLYGSAAQIVGIFKSMLPAIKPVALFFVGMTQSTQALTGYLGEFGKTMIGAANAAAKMRVAVLAAIGGMSAIVLGIAAAVYLLTDRFDAAAFAQKQFADAKQKTIEVTAAETAELNKNFAILEDVKSSTEDRRKAIDALQAAYPEYLRSIDLEKASGTELVAIQKQINDQILRGVAERQKAAAINSIYEEQAKILLRIQEIRRKGEITVGEATLINTGDLIRNGSNAAAVIEKLEQRSKSLGEQANITAKDFDAAFGLQGKAYDFATEKEAKARQAYYDSRDALEGVTVAQTTYTHSTKEAAKAAKEAAKEEKDRFKELRDFWANPINIDTKIAVPTLPNVGLPAIGNELDFGPTINQLVDGLGSINALTSGIQDTVVAGISPAQAVMKSLGENSQNFSDIYDEVVQKMAQNGSLLQNVFLEIGGAMSQAAASGASSFKDLANAAAGAAVKIVRAWIQQGVAAAVAKALGGLPFPFNLAAGAAAGAAAGVLFNKAIKSIGVPSLAEGGVATRPTLALIGDAGTGNPEIVTPERKLRQIFRNEGDGGPRELYSIIRGDDLLLTTDRAKARRDRIR